MVSKPAFSPIFGTRADVPRSHVTWLNFVLRCLLLEDVMNSSLPFLCRLQTAALLGAISISTAYADMLVLTAQADGQYDYGIQLDAITVW